MKTDSGKRGSLKRFVIFLSVVVGGLSIAMFFSTFDVASEDERKLKVFKSKVVRCKFKPVGAKSSRVIVTVFLDHKTIKRVGNTIYKNKTLEQYEKICLLKPLAKITYRIKRVLYRDEPIFRLEGMDFLEVQPKIKNTVN